MAATHAHVHLSFSGMLYTIHEKQTPHSPLPILLVHCKKNWDEGLETNKIPSWPKSVRLSLVQ